MLWSPWHQDLGELAMDVAGARSMVARGEPYDLTEQQRIYLFSRADTIYGGSDEIQRGIIGERALGLPRQARPDRRPERGCQPPRRPADPPGRDLLAGKVVVITAAAGTGIGSAVARRCLDEGAQVMLSDQHERRLAAARRRARRRLGTAGSPRCPAT